MVTLRRLKNLTKNHYNSNILFHEAPTQNAPSTVSEKNQDDSQRSKAKCLNKNEFEFRNGNQNTHKKVMKNIIEN